MKPIPANVLDALVLVDLRETPNEVLARYIGRDSLALFREEAGRGR